MSAFTLLNFEVPANMLQNEGKHAEAAAILRPTLAGLPPDAACDTLTEHAAVVFLQLQHSWHARVGLAAAAAAGWPA